MAALPDSAAPTSPPPAGPTVVFSSPQPRQILVQVMLETEETSRLIIHDLAMQIDQAVVRMGGIGGVQTLPAVRHRGYARLMLARAVEHMSEQGFDVSVLFGIHNFYHRYGFVTSLVDSRITMPTRLAEGVGQAVAAHQLAGEPLPAIRRYQPDRDLPAILELYHQKNAGRTGFLGRQPGTWSGFQLGSTWGRQTEVYVLTEGEGLFEKVRGYAAIDRGDEEVTVSEIEAADPWQLDFLIGYLGQLAVNRRVGQISWFIHPESEAARRLRYLGCEVTQTYAFDRGAMARLIHLERTLRKLLPVLNERWARAVAAGHGANGPVDLELAIWDANDPRPDLVVNPFIAPALTGDSKAEATVGAAEVHAVRPQAVRLYSDAPGQPLQVTAIENPSPAAASLPQELFTQLLLGYRPATEVAAAPAVHVTPEQVELLTVLFPTGVPYVPRCDRF